MSDLPILWRIDQWDDATHSFKPVPGKSYTVDQNDKANADFRLLRLQHRSEYFHLVTLDRPGPR